MLQCYIFEINIIMIFLSYITHSHRWIQIQNEIWEIWIGKIFIMIKIYVFKIFVLLFSKFIDYGKAIMNCWQCIWRQWNRERGETRRVYHAVKRSLWRNACSALIVHEKQIDCSSQVRRTDEAKCHFLSRFFSFIRKYRKIISSNINSHNVSVT